MLLYNCSSTLRAHIYRDLVCPCSCSLWYWRRQWYRSCGVITTWRTQFEIHRLVHGKRRWLDSNDNKSQTALFEAAKCSWVHSCSSCWSDTSFQLRTESWRQIAVRIFIVCVCSFLVKSQFCSELARMIASLSSRKCKAMLQRGREREKLQPSDEFHPEDFLQNCGKDSSIL